MPLTSLITQTYQKHRPRLLKMGDAAMHLHMLFISYFELLFLVLSYFIIIIIIIILWNRLLFDCISKQSLLLYHYCVDSTIIIIIIIFFLCYWMLSIPIRTLARHPTYYNFVLTFIIDGISIPQSPIAISIHLQIDSWFTHFDQFYKHYCNKMYNNLPL